MLIDIVKKSNLKQRKVVIHTSNNADDRIDDFVNYIQNFENKIIGYSRKEQMILNLVDIFNFYTSNKKVYATTVNGDYLIKMRLYELESSLNQYFIRISNTDIINIYHVQSFKREGINTICVILKNNSKLYVSRRYWPVVKKKMEELSHEKAQD